jgi:hypothetical protein
MPANEKFLQARSAEHRRRLFSYQPFAEPLRLPLRNGRVVSIPQKHITLQALIDLELVGNPFVAGGRPSPWDAYRLLWRLHPAYAARGAWLPRLRLAVLSARLMWPAAALLVRERIAQAYQDQPAGDAGAEPSATAPLPCMFDDLCRLFIGSYGLSRAEVLHSPLAWLLQLLRSEALSAPDADVAVIDPSAELLFS